MSAPMMKRMFADDQVQAEFWQKGYVVMRVLSEADVDLLLSEIRELKPEDNFEANLNNGLNIGYHTAFSDSNRDYKEQVNRLIHQFFSVHVNEVLVDYKILFGAILVKPPGKGNVLLHRDWVFTDDFNDVNITFWCPLVDVDETNGSLQMVAGSHRLVPNIECPHTEPFYSRFADSLKQQSTPLQLKAGEAVVFDTSIFHWSPPNNSAAPRIAAGCMCISQQSHSVFYYPDRASPDKRFEVFEMSNEAFSQHRGVDFLNGNFKTKSLGFVANKNRAVSEAEFFGMLEKGDEIRRRLFFPQAEPKTSTGKTSVINRIKAALRICGIGD
jgi:ectoine hydroxylase-related dioxygenase (phytanoyl-CoA dioxygenase family)